MLLEPITGIRKRLGGTAAAPLGGRELSLDLALEGFAAHHSSTSGPYFLEMRTPMLAVTMPQLHKTKQWTA